ncbi:MAG: amidohydrolase family protein [Anaerolineae bacterium]|nr:amidohydrolase family protein [Anaerolineae bacterium]
MIIEWNAHMFSSDVSQYPFHPKATYKPSPDRRPQDPLSEYIIHLYKMGIEKAVLVQPEPYGDDHSLVLDCLDREPDRFWATSLFFPKDNLAPEHLTALKASQPKIVATRFHAHRGKENYLHSFQDDHVIALWETAGELGLIIELHIGPNYASQVKELVKSYPHYPVLIDHCAEPQLGNAVEYADVLSLSSYDNVYMKLSGLSHFSDNAPLYQETKAFTKLLSDAFGPTRLIWSSGTPEIVDVHLDFLTPAERDLVKGGNLMQLLS